MVGSDQYEHVTARKVGYVSTFVKPSRIMNTVLRASKLWEIARYVDYWAQLGFFSYDEAAKVWSVTADLAEENGAFTRAREARENEASFRRFVGPQLPPSEGPLLPWPEVHRRDVASSRRFVPANPRGDVVLPRSGCVSHIVCYGPNGPLDADFTMTANGKPVALGAPIAAGDVLHVTTRFKPLRTTKGTYQVYANPPILTIEED